MVSTWCAMKRVHQLSQPVREILNNIAFEFLPTSSSVAPSLDSLELRLREADMFRTR